MGLSQSFLLTGVARPDHGLSSNSQDRKDLCQGLCHGLVGHLCLRGLTWRVGMRLIQVARSLLVAASPPVLLSLEEKGVWELALLVCQSPQLLQPPHHLHLQLFRLVCFSTFLINGEALHPTGLCLILFRVTIFSLGPILPCSMTSGTLMSRQQQLIIQLFRGRSMSFLLREQLNPLWVVLVSILACLWYLRTLGAFDPYSTRSILIVICTYLLLRCQLLNMYGSLSSKVIMPFPSIYRMHIYIFPLLRITIVSYILLGIMCLISGRSYLLGLLHPLGFLCPSPNLFCSFAITKVHVLLSIWMTSWSSFTLSGQVRGNTCFCVPHRSIFVYISIF